MDREQIVEIGARALHPSAFDVESNPHRDPKVDAELAKMRNSAREAARVVLVRVLLDAFEEAGLVVAPVEPTEAMIEAASGFGQPDAMTLRTSYRAMIAAAKADPQ